MSKQNKYLEAYSKLSGYRQKELFGTLVNGKMEYEGISIHVNPIIMDLEVKAVKELFKDYNFKIIGYTNSETITIK